HRPRGPRSHRLVDERAVLPLPACDRPAGALLRLHLRPRTTPGTRRCRPTDPFPLRGPHRLLRAVRRSHDRDGTPGRHPRPGRRRGTAFVCDALSWPELGVLNGGSVRCEPTRSSPHEQGSAVLPDYADGSESLGSLPTPTDGPSESPGPDPTPTASDTPSENG